MSAMHGVLADVMLASETGEDRTIATVLNDAIFAVADQAQCTERQQRTAQLVAQEHDVVWRQWWRATVMDGVEARSKLHSN